MFQVIGQDGQSKVLATYNEANEIGKITKDNEKVSFYAANAELKGHIEAIEQYILNYLTEEV